MYKILIFLEKVTKSNHVAGLIKMNVNIYVSSQFRSAHNLYFLQNHTRPIHYFLHTTFNHNMANTGKISAASTLVKGKPPAKEGTPPRKSRVDGSTHKSDKASQDQVVQ
jgi:hypothetical protein